MPFSSRYVAPEVYLSHRGLTVYRIYEDDDVERGPRPFWFSLSPRGSDRDAHGENGTFDVRRLPGPGRDRYAGAAPAIRAAIDAGALDGWRFRDADGREAVARTADITVGDLRAAIDGLPDDEPVRALLCGGPGAGYRPVTGLLLRGDAPGLAVEVGADPEDDDEVGGGEDDGAADEGPPAPAPTARLHPIAEQIYAFLAREGYEPGPAVRFVLLDPEANPAEEGVAPALEAASAAAAFLYVQAADPDHDPDDPEDPGPYRFSGSVEWSHEE